MDFYSVEFNYYSFNLILIIIYLFAKNEYDLKSSLYI